MGQQTKCCSIYNNSIMRDTIALEQLSATEGKGH